jgi:drug/metabolite transporter (DMT)-like permease
MDQPANKWWWLPGVLLSVAGLLFLGTAGLFGDEEVWIPVGVGFIAVSAFVVHRSRPRAELAT